MRGVLTYLFIAVFTLNTGAQERSLTIETDRQEIMLGEHIQMRVTLKSAAADTAMLPNVGDTLRKEIEVLSRSKVDTSFEGNHLEERILRQSFTITSFDSGYFPVEPLAATVNGDTIFSNAILVAVQTIDVDTAKGPIDIKEIEEVPFAWKEWFQENWHWFALGILVIVLIYLIARYYKNQPAPEFAPDPPIPARPAHEIALERLAHLNEKGLWQQGNTKAFYVELSEILRAFIEGRFAIPALEQTTDEILQSMRRNPNFSEETRQNVKSVLFLADLVKFAKEKPVGAENEAQFVIVERFVQSFILEEQTEIEAPSASDLNHG